MRVLAVGDIVGKGGVEKLKVELPRIVEENKIDFVIVNGENAADGMGLTEKLYREILMAGANIVTMGNHTWAKKDIFGFIEDEKIIRPANYPENNPGRGYQILECKGKKIAVINLIGRVTMNVLSENPFLKARSIIDEIKNQVDMIIVDFHGEATAEKIAFANYVDGEATIVFGTHTHVQTADEQILPKGTGFICDIGMTGPIDSVIGMEIEASLKRFETSLPEKYKIAEGKSKLNSVMFQINDETNKVEKIVRINRR
ncbi:MAG: TIGR00282 family metallophosphoesterase [Clostridia bacterium]|nr:TIGR00282 family metallophosphoesterase [Clostridia bacterium]